MPRRDLAADKYYVYRPLLDLIGFTEGTDKGDRYNETLAYGRMLDGVRTRGAGKDVSLVTMTLKQVDALQTRMLADPDNAKLNSSACGRYQIVRTTLRAIRKALELSGAELFDEGMQDRMACYLLGVRGIDKYLSGRMKEATLIDNLAKEWASLPTTADKGYYGGQHAAVKSDRVREVLAEVRRRHKEGQPVERVSVPVPVDRPVVPERVEKEVRQKTNWLSGVISSLFGGGGLLAWVSGMDWQSLALVAGIGAVVLIVVLVGGEWIVRRVKSIRREIEA